MNCCRGVSPAHKNYAQGDSDHFRGTESLSGSGVCPGTGLPVPSMCQCLPGFCCLCKYLAGCPALLYWLEVCAQAVALAPGQAGHAATYGQRQRWMAAPMTARAQPVRSLWRERGSPCAGGTGMAEAEQRLIGAAIPWMGVFQQIREIFFSLFGADSDEFDEWLAILMHMSRNLPGAPDISASGLRVARKSHL